MLGGHTDDRGDGAYNRELSKRRAESAKKYLVDAYGVSPDRLETAGFGSDHPKDTATTAEARQRNRRVVLEMIEYAQPESIGSITRSSKKRSKPKASTASATWALGTFRDARSSSPRWATVSPCV